MWKLSVVKNGIGLQKWYRFDSKSDNLEKTCQIECQSSNFCYFQMEKKQIKQNVINKRKLPHEIIGENLHRINSANSSATTEVTLKINYFRKDI